MALIILPSLESVKAQFRECFGIYSASCYTSGRSNSCVILDAFCAGSDTEHNCIGCQLADSSDMIKHYLSRHETLDDIQQDFTVYILLLYLLAEKIEVILEIIQLPETVRAKHFAVFQNIRKWANFIKHPKSFALTHHPTYDFDNSGTDNRNKGFSVIIDESFVDKYYKGLHDQEKQKKNNKELAVKLANKNNVLVLFPDISRLTEKVCYSFNKFIEVLTGNPIFLEILKDQSTLDNYFENEGLIICD